MLGSGEPDFEQRMLEHGRRNANFVFLCGYSEALAEPLYAVRATCS